MLTSGHLTLIMNCSSNEMLTVEVVGVEVIEIVDWGDSGDDEEEPNVVVFEIDSESEIGILLLRTCTFVPF